MPALNPLLAVAAWTGSAASPARPAAAVLAHGDADARGWPALVTYLAAAALAAGYGRGVHELWHRRGAGAVVPRRRAAAFGLGLAVLAAAESPAAHAAADRSFPLHMVQHMALLVAAGPLLAAGAAGVPLSVAAPRAARRALGRLRHGRAVRWARQPARRAAAAAAAWTALLWLWHLPAPYAAAVHHGPVHAAEHLCLLGSSWLLWSCVWGDARHRLPAPAGLLLVFVTGLPATALGVVLALAPPLYPRALLAPAGGDPGIAQHLAGVAMWAPMETVVVAMALATFVRWLAGMEQRLPAGNDRPLGGPAADGAGR
jgi:putative membrane protein